MSEEVLTAVKILRRRALFAESRGSYTYAGILNAAADLGEEVAQAQIDETRKIGKQIVDEVMRNEPPHP